MKPSRDNGEAGNQEESGETAQKWATRDTLLALQARCRDKAGWVQKRKHPWNSRREKCSRWILHSTKEWERAR